MNTLISFHEFRNRHTRHTCTRVSSHVRVRNDYSFQRFNERATRIYDRLTVRAVDGSRFTTVRRGATVIQRMKF